MRKVWVVFLMLAVLVFTSCTYGGTVEELLYSPALTSDQNAILNTIAEHAGEKSTMLKYPTSGERRAPIQFVDLDSDGISEAVVFFSIPSDDIYAQIAVLKKDEGEWKICSVITGAGTDVESISVIRLEDNFGRFLLVEWSSSNTRFHQLTAYHYSEEGLSVGFEESCSDILVYDLDMDGFKEFCYITPGNSYEPFMLKFVDNASGVLALVGESSLNEEMLGSEHIIAGKLGDGRDAVFVDENIGEGLKTTEIFVVNDGNFEPVSLAEGFNIKEIAKRSTDDLSSQNIFGGNKIYIPSEIQPFAEILQPQKWNYWYTVRNAEIVYSGTTYIDSVFHVSIRVPDEWLSYVSVIGTPSEPRMIEFIDTAKEQRVLQLKILEIGEDALPYINNGYRLLTQSGSFRYYINYNCTPEDATFVSSNFSII